MSSSSGKVQVNGTVGMEEEAELLKQEANECFKKKHYEEAIVLYNKAIERNPNVAVYYGNRSIAYFNTECFGYALRDATKALELDKKYLKGAKVDKKYLEGYYRRAMACMSLGRFKDALKDFESVIKAKPNDPQAKEKWTECNKIVKRKAFENAIAVKDRCVSESIDFESMAIEDEYTGPMLEDGKVTKKFMVELMDLFKKQGKLHRKFAFKIMLDCEEYFKKQPTLVDIKATGKFTVCGDIHGQFYDLMNVFELNGIPSEENPYLFNGDFVDRGSFSAECILTLLGFKLLYPNHFYMARGNHESENMNEMYGFKGEIRHKYTAQMADLFTEVFNYLPLAHLINEKVLVMHGGLFAKDDVTLSDIRNINRNMQPPDSGLMCDLLWSDPQPSNGRAPSKRGVGIQFGPDITASFLSKNKLEYVIRSHEVKEQGYEVDHNGKCITVFSAPNYCDQMGNKGAYIILDGQDPKLEPKFVVYDAVPHPNVRPMAYASSLLSLL